jgi:hypothetical protein
MGIARLAIAFALIVFLSQPAMGGFRLEIGGTPALKFTATCEAVGGADEGTYRLSGLVPRRYDIDADAVRCQVRMEDVSGRLSAQLIAGGRVVAAATSAAFRSVVEVRSTGPWGKARARRVKRGAGFLELAPGTGGETVPPLEGETVPPIPGQGRIVPPLVPSP